MKRNTAGLLFIILIQFICLSAKAHDFYWIGGSGNFNDIQHWSDQPGGRVNPLALLPDKDDNVYFDEFSFPDVNAEVVITSVARCFNMHWGDVQNTPRLTTDDNSAHYLVIYGGVKFNDQMILDLDRPLYFRANTLGHEIDFGGNAFDGDFYFENNGGWRLVSTTNLLDNNIYFNQGTLSVEAELTCGSIYSEASVSRELYLNSSTINLQKNGNPVISFQADNLNVYPGSSIILVSSTNSSVYISGTNPISFYDLEFTADNGLIENENILTSFHDVTFNLDGQIKGDNYFNDLNLTAGHSYSIFNGTQIVNGNFNAVGECYAYINLIGDVFGGTISAESANLAYLKVKNINAVGAGVPFVANSSYDLGGNNANWMFMAPSSADYTWIGAAGDGNWGTSANWDSACVPSRNNNAIIPANFVVNVNVGAECKDLIIDDNSSIEGSSTLAIFGSLSADNCTWNFSGEMEFSGDNSNSISLNKAILGPVLFNGSGDWTFASDLTILNTLELLEGNVFSAGFKLSVAQFISTSSLIRTFDITNSILIITDGVTKAWNVAGNNFNITSTNSEIKLISDAAEFYNNSSDYLTYGNVVFNFPDGQVFLRNEGAAEPSFKSLLFNGNAKLYGNHQFDKLQFSKGKQYLFSAGSRQKIVVADGLVAQGTCSDYISFKGDEGIAFFECDVASTDLRRLRIEDVNVVGSIGTLSASESVGISGYDGWFFPNDLIGGEIKWIGAIDSDWFNAGNWSTGCIPTRLDDVIFNELNIPTTGNKAVSISKRGMVAECHHMIWSNANLMSFSGDQPVYIFGSLDFSGMDDANFDFSGEIYFKSTLAETIDAETVTLLSDLNFEGRQKEDGTWEAGEWTLSSALHTMGSMFLKNGGIITNNQDLEAESFVSNSGPTYIRSLSLGASKFRLERFEISPDAFSFNSGTSEIIFTKGGELVVSKGDTPILFYDVTFDDVNANGYIDTYSDAIGFNNLVLKGNAYFRKKNDSEISFTAEKLELAVGKTYVFESSQEYILGNLIANGACEGTIDITGSGATQATLKAKAGVTAITVNLVNILNVKADPANVFVAKASIDLGGADGWTFEDEPEGLDLYWVGGTGYWDDPNNWATSSGATVANGCVPTAKDNVFFDSGSFTNTEQIVYTGASDIRCKTMDWSGSEAARPHFEIGDVDITGVYIYGSLLFNPNVEIDLSPMVNFHFRGSEAQEINSFGYVFPSHVIFDGNGGEWKLQGDLQMEGDCIVSYGKLITDGHALECKSLLSSDETDSPSSRGIDIRNSKVSITGQDDNHRSSMYLKLANGSGEQVFDFYADNSEIVFTDDAEIVIFGSRFNTIIFDKIVFEKNGVLNSGFVGISPYVNYLQFKGNGSVKGPNKFGTVDLGRGFEFKFEEGQTYEMDFLLAEGSCFAPIYLHSSKEGLGKETTIRVANNVVGNFLELKDIVGDTFNEVSYTATNSHDLGNVVGWEIDGAVAPIDLYWTGNGADDSWHNHKNWSRSADGSEEGCEPSLNDDVFFTANSFLGSKQVELLTDGECHNITWVDDVDPSANFTIDASLVVAGFMDLTESMQISMNGTFNFIGDGLVDDKMLDFADKTMDGDLIFNGDNQNWVWTSGLITSGNLYLESGALTTGGKDFTIGKFNSLSLGDFYANRKFDMSGSLVSVTSETNNSWNMKMNTDGGLDFTANSTLITFENGGGIYCETDEEVTFESIDFKKNGILKILGSGEGNFNSVKFMEQGQIYGDNTFKNLEFTLGYENNTIESGKTITVTNDLMMEGVRCSYLFLKASSRGNKAFIHNPSGLFDHIYNASLTDITGTSGSGDDHPVKYHFESNNTSGFFLEPIGGDGTEDPPSFEGDFDQPREEWCSETAVLDHVRHFPINSHTTFQWYFSLDGTDDSYEPIPNEINAIIEVSETGFYKVEVIYGENTVADDGSLCKIESVIEVRLGTVSNVSLEITANNVKCFGEGNGRIDAKVINEMYPEYQFTWKDEEGNDFTPSTSTDRETWVSTALDLSPGKYYINVADGKNCEYNTVVNIFDAYELIIDEITTKDLACFTVPEGEILVVASGGTGNASYFLDNSLQASANFTGLYAGEYSVHVQDENLCRTLDAPVSINSNPEILVDLNATNILCYQDNSGGFMPNVTGGVPNYSFEWTGPDDYTATSETISGLAGGSYQLKITDAVNCVSTVSDEIIEPLTLEPNELIIEPAICHNENSGEVFIEARQGTPPYQYFLDEVEKPSGIFPELTPNEYALKIIDANGCVFEENITIENPGMVGFLVEDLVMPTCENIYNGIVRIAPYGGASGYSYSWSGPNDFRSYDQNIENIESGEYNLLIKDKNNCSFEDVVDLNLDYTIQLGLVVEQHVKTAGGEDGILAIETQEGTAPYIFTVSGPNGYASTSPDNYDEHLFLIENLAGGVYTVEATDVSGCSSLTKSIIIEEQDKLFAFVEEVQAVGCSDQPVGELKVNARGGNGSFVFTWTGPSGYSNVGQTIFGLAEGVYTVNVTSGGQTVSATYELISPDPISVSVANVKNVSCNNAADGEIELDIDFGSADYSIEWTGDNGFFSSAKHILDLEPATYNYTIRSEYGCTVSGSQIITEPTPLDLNVDPFNISEEGERDGTLSAQVTGGTAPYQFLVSGPNDYSFEDPDNMSGSISITDLEMGVYEVVVLDNHECRIEDTKKVHEPMKLLLYVISKTNITCFGESDGAIEIGVLGESDPSNLSFSWTGDHYFRSNDKNISGLRAGRYVVTVNDSAGDPGYEEQSLQVILTEPEEIVAEFWKKDISCYGLTDGYINIHPKGGTPAYTFLWEGDGVNPTDQDQQGLTKGTYSVQVTDSRNCKSLPTSIEILEPLQISASVLDYKEPSCYGFEDAWIKLTIEEGSAPYLVSWDNYGSISQDIFDLEKGYYQFTVEDKYACKFHGEITLNQPDTLIAEVNDFTDVLCHGEHSGRATVAISGGTPTYTIEWSNGQETEEISELSIGRYEVRVTDEHACSDTSSVVLTQPEPLLLEIEARRPTTVDAMDGAISLNVTGGVEAYEINWNGLEYSGLHNEELPRGNYEISIVDANYCQLDSIVNLEYLYENRIKIPKAFTPNGDGYNDYWDLERIEYVQYLKIVIYDRWGKAIYKFSGTGNEYRGDPWTGENGISSLPIGSYYYAVELDDEKPIIGSVTILR